MYTNVVLIFLSTFSCSCCVTFFVSFTGLFVLVLELAEIFVVVCISGCADMCVGSACASNNCGSCCNGGSDPGIVHYDVDRVSQYNGSAIIEKIWCFVFYLGGTKVLLLGIHLSWCGCFKEGM